MSHNTTTIDAIKQELRATGLRATPARIAILKLLRETNIAMTHADVAARLTPVGVDMATVFRSLNGMVEVGLLRKLELGDHVWRFEAILDEADRDNAHPHFLCVDCGTVTCMERVHLTSRSQSITSAVGEVTDILVRGHCNQCR